MRRGGLTAKQFRFCIEYVKDRSAGKALVRAGYDTSGANARAIATHLLRRPEIQAEIAKHTEAVAATQLVTVERVVKELVILGFFDPKDYFSWNGDGHLTLKASDDLPPGASRAISEITNDRRVADGVETSKIRIKFHSKDSALAKLGDFLGMFKKRVELTDPQGKNPLTAALEDMWNKIEDKRNGGGTDGQRVIGAGDGGDGGNGSEVIDIVGEEVAMGESPRLLPKQPSITNISG